MYENINERIKVVAVFGDTYRDVRPFKAEWRGKEIVVKQVSYIHPTKVAGNVRHVFSVTDGANYYELIFDAIDLSWLIGRVSDHEAN